jgi:hypothetical protein
MDPISFRRGSTASRAFRNVLAVALLVTALVGGVEAIDNSGFGATPGRRGVRGHDDDRADTTAIRRRLVRPAHLEIFQNRDTVHHDDGSYMDLGGTTTRQLQGGSDLTPNPTLSP